MLSLTCDLCDDLCDYLSLSVPVWVPTKEYSKGDLRNASLCFLERGFMNHDVRQFFAAAGDGKRLGDFFAVATEFLCISAIFPEERQFLDLSVVRKFRHGGIA